MGTEDFYPRFPKIDPQTNNPPPKQDIPFVRTDKPDTKAPFGMPRAPIIGQGPINRITTLPLNGGMNDGFGEATPSAAVTTAPAEGNIKPLHTFNSDVTEAMKSNKTSIADIVTAEQERKRKEALFQANDQEEDRGNKNTIVMIGIVLGSLILLSIGGYFLFIIVAPALQQQSPTAASTLPNDIVTSESSTNVVISNENRDAIMQAITGKINSSIPFGTVEKVMLVHDDATNTPLGSDEIASLVGPEMPNILLLSIADNPYFGIYSSSGGNQPFIVFKISSYEDAYSGMNAWESNMIRDVQPIFLSKSDQLAGPYFTVTTSGESYTFRDALFQNKDIRIIQNKQGKIIFLYSFVDPTTLVITTNENTLKEILNRMIQTKLVR
jgi:hypothetical protein